MNKPHTLMGDRILTTEDILDAIPLDKTTIWRLEKEGKFPKHFKIGGSKAKQSKNGWWQSDIQEWIDALPNEPRPLATRYNLPRAKK